MAEPDPLLGVEDEEAFILEQSDLSPTHKLFVASYMRHRNVSRAAREAGYSAPNVGHDLVGRNAKVREMMAALTSARLRRLQVTPARVEQELAKVAFASMQDISVVQEDGTAYLDFSRAQPELWAAVKAFSCEIDHKPGDDRDAPRQVLKMKVELGDKLSALGKLAQILKMIQGDNAVTVAVDVADAIREARARAGLSSGGESE